MAMTKIIDPSGWNWDRPVVQMIKMSSHGLTGCDRRDFIKTASHVFVDLLDNIKLAKDEIPVHLIALGASEFYGCFAKGTLVRLGDSTVKPIEQIQFDDVVVTHTGGIGKVTTLYSREYVGEVCRIAVAGVLDDITCTANHQFFVIPQEQVQCKEDRSKHCKPSTCQKNALCKAENCSRSHVRYFPEWRRADEIKPGDYMLVPIPDREVGSASWRWMPEFAKLLGYFLAEGSFTKKHGKLTGLSFCFHADEETTLFADLKNCVKAILDAGEYTKLKIGGPYKGNGNCIQCTIASAALAERVNRYVGEYAGEKYLGGVCYSQEPELLRYFFAGWLDGDGTHPNYHRKNGYTENRYTIHTASRQLALDAQWLLGRLNVAAAVCPVHDGDRGYHVSFSNTAGEIFAGVSFKHRSHPPQQEKEHSFIWNGYVCRPVRKIDTCDAVMPVYNFEVEGDHSYTVSNGIAAKNCNRNGDGFKEATCRQYHDTFMKYAKFFRNHKNKLSDNDPFYGNVKLSAYNEAMHRVELLAILNASKEAAERNGGLVADKELAKLADDEDISVSMACRVSHDICSGCGHKARTRKEYCREDTCKYGGCYNNITKVAEDGHVLHVDNPNPLFFDISHVFRPADRIAYGAKADYLAKAASHLWVPGAEMAEALDVSAPLHVCLAQEEPSHWSDELRGHMKLARALAVLENNGENLSSDTYRAFARDVRTPISQDQWALIGAPGTEKAAEALGALADNYIMFSLSDFANWTGRSSAYKQAAQLLPGIYQKLISDGDLEDRLTNNRFACSTKTASLGQRVLARSLKHGHSLDMEAVKDRTMRSALKRASVPEPKKAFWNEKLASEEPAAAELAEEYALYKLAALHRIAAFDQDFKLTARLAIGQNRIVH